MEGFSEYQIVYYTMWQQSSPRINVVHFVPALYTLFFAIDAIKIEIYVGEKNQFL